jgi:hypothetical protein
MQYHTVWLRGSVLGRAQMVNPRVCHESKHRGRGCMEYGNGLIGRQSSSESITFTRTLEVLRISDTIIPPCYRAISFDYFGISSSK